MSTNNGQGNPDKKNSESDYEFIDESEIQSVKRGRKSIVFPEMIEFFKKVKIGQTIKMAKLALNPVLFSELEKAVELDDKEKIAEISAEIRKVKATRSALIRSQAYKSDWEKTTVIWDKFGVPYAKRQA